MTGMRFVGWILMAILLVVLIYSVWNSQDDNILPQKKTQILEEPLFLTQPIVREFEGNWLRYRLTAESAQIFEQKKITKLSQIKVQLFELSELIPKVRINAKSGEMNNKSGLLHLWGAVRINMVDGQRLLTEELFFNQNKNVVYNNVTVIAFSEREEIIADSMHYNITKGVLVLEKPKAKIEL